MITLPSTVLVLRLAVVGAAIAAAASVEFYLEQRAEAQASTRIGQAFGAVLWIPPSEELGAALMPARSDRGVISAVRRSLPSITVEQQRGETHSELVRVEATEFAQR